MTTLKFKDTDGTWKLIPITGPPGAGVPVGGAVGDILVKQSATDRDTRWGTDPPKLRLTSTVVADLTSTTHALTLGDAAGFNVAISGSRIQARQAGGLASPLRLNQSGGQVVVGAGGIASDGTVQGMNPSAGGAGLVAIGFTGETAEGGQLNLNGAGSNASWSIDNLSATLRMFSGGIVYLALSTSLATFQTGAQFGGNLRIGGGSGPQIATNGDYIHLNADTDCYYDGNTHYWRNVGGGTAKMTLDSSHTLTVVGQIYAGVDQFFRARGNGGFYFESWGGGWYMSDATWIRSYGNKNVYCNVELRAATLSFDGSCNVTSPGLYYRLYNGSDNNHKMLYANATPTGSGEASNGPQLSGYTSVWLYNMTGNKNFYLSSNGNVFVSSGCTYNAFSSREFKHNIKTLDPERALLMVNRWRPVEYDWNEDQNTPHPHGFGFISEEHAEILPEMCNIYGEGHDGPENERLVVHRPGWANAIDYSLAAPWLAGAVQALTMRVAALETELERKAA